MQAVERSARQTQQRTLTPVPGGESIGGNGTIPIPSGVPEVIQKVIAGANEIADFPYVYGGGHASFIDNAYDCSGSVSYALAAGGLLSAPGDLRSAGELGRAGTRQVHHRVRQRRSHLHVRRRDPLRHRGTQRRVCVALAGAAHGQRRLRRAPLARAVADAGRARASRSASPSSCRWRSTAKRKQRTTPGSASSRWSRSRSATWGCSRCGSSCSATSRARSATRTAPTDSGTRPGRLRRARAASSADERDVAHDRGRGGAARGGVAHDQAQHQRDLVRRAPGAQRCAWRTGCAPRCARPWSSPGSLWRSRAPRVSQRADRRPESR